MELSDHYVLKYLFCPPLLLVGLTHAENFIFLTAHQAMVIFAFHSYFSLCFILGSFYQYIIKFTDISFFSVLSAFNYILCILHLRYYMFSPLNFHLGFLILPKDVSSISLLIMFSFSLTSQIMLTISIRPVLMSMSIDSLSLLFWVYFYCLTHFPVWFISFCFLTCLITCYQMLDDYEFYIVCLQILLNYFKEYQILFWCIDSSLQEFDPFKPTLSFVWIGPVQTFSLGLLYPQMQSCNMFEDSTQCFSSYKVFL